MPHHSRRPRALLRATGLAATALAAAALLTWQPAPATGWNQGAAEATLWQLTNGARVNNGRRALQQHSTLVSLARWRSQDSVQRDYFSHTILGTNYQVYHWYDLNGLRYSWGGENIGWNNGYSDADSPIQIHEGFMASAGHRANILEPSFTHGGIGAYAADNVSFLGKLRSPRFYTELFMTAAGTAAPPPPSSGTSTPSRRAAVGSTRPAPAPTPTAMTVRAEPPAAPQASAPLDGPQVVASADISPAPAALRAMAGEDAGAITPAPPLVATSQRVQAAQAAERGLFEAMLGSLLGFFL